MKSNAIPKKIKEFSKKNNGRGINHILNIAYEVLGNPIVMFDTSYSLLAHTENTVEDDFLWNEFTRLGTFSHHTVNFFNNEHFINVVANSDVISILKSDNLKYDRLNAKIFDINGVHIANITVVACYRPFEKRDFKEIEVICNSLSFELQKSEYYQKIERISDETFITNLIEGKNIDKIYIQKNLEDLYADMKSHLYVAVIDITKYEYTLTHLAYFRDLFKKIQKEFKYFIYLNNIIAILSTDNLTLNINKYLKKLKTFCINNNLYIGISDSFQNLLELQKYYKQALNALNYGLNNNLNNEHHIFEYSNFKLDYFLSVDNNKNFKDICHPVVFLIKEYDKNNATSYYDVLCTYLSVGKNSCLASKKIKINHQDFCNQLQKIEEIFGIDWNNGDMLSSVFISIKIMKCFL